MRILHVTREVHDDRRYGLGRSLDPVLGALRAAGHDVRLLTQDQLGPRARRWQAVLTQRLTPLVRMMFGPAAPVLLQVWLERLNMGRLAAKVAARDAADVVHLHDPYIACGYRSLRGRSRARWGISEHGFGAYADAIREEGVPFSPRLLRWCRRVEARVLAAADWVLCPTQAARAQLARDHALPAPPAHWHAVGHPLPEAEPLAREAARAQLGWHPDEWHVVAVGRINPVKRFDLLVEACIRVGRPLHLHVLGGGDAQGLVSAALAAPKLRLEVRPVPDTALWLAAADVYVSSSLNESFGLANLEALAAGVPCICTAVGGVPEVMGAAAWLVPGDPDAIAEALRQNQDDVALRAHFGRLGRARAAAWPGAAHWARLHEEVYRGMA